MPDAFRKVVWISGARSELLSFPEEVRRVMGYAIYLAQNGRRHPAAVPQAGFGGSGVLEVIEAWAGDAWRLVYTIDFPGSVCVLCAFQKKSHRGIQTPRRNLDLIRARLKAASRFLGN